MKNFSFLLPSFLLLIPITAAILIYLYRKKGKAHKVIVSSLIFLGQILSTSENKRKVRFPIRMLVELLMLSLLALGVAGLFKKDGAVNIAIIMDNSFSMQQIDPEDPLSTSAFEVAKREASTYVTHLDGNARVSVYIVSPKLVKIADQVNKNTADSIIQSIRGTAFSNDNMDGALEETARTSYKEIVVFTDKPAKEESTIKSKIIVKNVSYNDKSNFALEKMTPFVHGDNLDITTILHSYANQSNKLIITLYGINKFEMQDSLPWREITNKEVSLSPFEQKEIIFKNIKKEYLFFKAAINSKPGNSTVKDTVSGDNEAFLAIAQPKGELIVIGDNSNLGLNKLSAFNVQNLTEEQVRSSNIDENALLIFYKHVPEELPSNNTLFILPNKKSPIFSVQGIEQNTNVTTWEEVSLLDYIKPSQYSFKSLMILKSDVLSPFLNSDKGSFALYGNYNNRGYVVLGFDIFPYQGRESTVNSIMTLNILKWLSRNLLVNNLTTYLPVKAQNASKINYFQGEELNINNDSVVPNKPGIIIVSTPDGSESYLAVNYFDENESNLLDQQSITMPKEEATIIVDNNHYYYDEIAWLVLGLWLIGRLIWLIKM